MHWEVIKILNGEETSLAEIEVVENILFVGKLLLSIFVTFLERRTNMSML